MEYDGDDDEHRDDISETMKSLAWAFGARTLLITNAETTHGVESTEAYIHRRSTEA